MQIDYFSTRNGRKFTRNPRQIIAKPTKSISIARQQNGIFINSLLLGYFRTRSSGMKTVTSGSHPHGALHGKCGFGAVEKEIHRSSKLQSLIISLNIHTE
jgi:hypothetical protein